MRYHIKPGKKSYAYNNMMYGVPKLYIEVNI